MLNKEQKESLVLAFKETLEHGAFDTERDRDEFQEGFLYAICSMDCWQTAHDIANEAKERQ